LLQEDEIDKSIEAVNKDFEKDQWTITSAMDEIIDGSRKVTDDELKAVDEFLSEGQAVTDELNDAKKIENYWLTVFQNAKIPLKEADKEIIKCLKQVDIRSELKQDEPNKPKILTLKLIFEENDYFEGTELTTALNFEGYEEIKKCEGCDIKWKPGKNVMTKIKTKKPTKSDKRNKKKGKIEEKIKELSFFDIFRSFNEPPAETEIDPNNLQPDLYYVQEMVDAIGDVAGEDSLSYYLDCVKMDDDLEGELGGIDEEDEDDESEDASPKKPSRKASTKSKGSKKGKKSRKNTEDEVKIPEEPNKEECKQN